MLPALIGPVVPGVAMQLALLLGVLGAVDAPPSPAAGDDEARTVLLVGDTMLARGMHQVVLEHGPQHPLEELSPLIADADIAVVNLECVVSTRGDLAFKNEKRPFLYRARPELLDVLTLAGVDVAVVANNHALDYGPHAFVEQLELLDAVGIAPVGGGRNLAEAEAVTYVATGSYVVAFIGLETSTPAFAAKPDAAGILHGRERPATVRRLAPIVEAARSRADLVIFTPHWGPNWTTNPDERRVRLAHAIIDLGVDAIFGHSSHHLHGIEIYAGKPIVYDMGSFVFDTSGKKQMRFSGVFVLTFDRGGMRKIAIHPAAVGDGRTEVARGPDRERVFEILRTATADLDPDLELTTNGGALEVELPRAPLRQPTESPAVVHAAGTTRPLPQELRARRTNVVYDAPPPWTRGFEPVQLERGVEVIGAWTPDAVRPGLAFRVEVALRVPGPLAGTWEAAIIGIERSTGARFTWTHAIADGNWMPHLWRAGQIVADRTLVRPVGIDRRGVYDLFWQLGPRDEPAPLKRVGAIAGEGAAVDMVPIGEIAVAEGPDVPRGLPGVWPDPNRPRVDPPPAEPRGEAPPVAPSADAERVAEADTPAPEADRAAGVLGRVAAVAAAAVLVATVVLARRRRRRG